MRFRLPILGSPETNPHLFFNGLQGLALLCRTQSTSYLISMLFCGRSCQALLHLPSLCHSVRQTYNSGCQHDKSSEHPHPLSLFMKLQDMADPLSCITLSKSRQAHGWAAPVCGEGKQRPAVLIPDILPHRYQHILITAHLHIPYHAEKGYPHQRMKPVYRQYKKGSDLDQMIPSPDVIPFMPQNIVFFCLPQVERDIDPGAEYSRNKG